MPEGGGELPVVFRVRARAAATVASFAVRSARPCPRARSSASSGCGRASPTGSGTSARDRGRSWRRIATPATSGRGRPRASRFREAGRWTVLLRVTPGPRTEVGHIVIAGLLATREEVVRRELRAAGRRCLGLQKVLESQRRLGSLGIFQRVSLERDRPGVGGRARRGGDGERGPAHHRRLRHRLRGARAPPRQRRGHAPQPLRAGPRASPPSPASASGAAAAADATGSRTSSGAGTSVRHRFPRGGGPRRLRLRALRRPAADRAPPPPGLEPDRAATPTRRPASSTSRSPWRRWTGSSAPPPSPAPPPRSSTTPGTIPWTPRRGRFVGADVAALARGPGRRQLPEGLPAGRHLPAAHRARGPRRRPGGWAWRAPSGSTSRCACPCPTASSRRGDYSLRGFDQDLAGPVVPFRFRRGGAHRRQRPVLRRGGAALRRRAAASPPRPSPRRATSTRSSRDMTLGDAALHRRTGPALQERVRAAAHRLGLQAGPPGRGKPVSTSTSRSGMRSSAARCHPGRPARRAAGRRRADVVERDPGRRGRTAPAALRGPACSGAPARPGPQGRGGSPHRRAAHVPARPRACPRPVVTPEEEERALSRAPVGSGPTSAVAGPREPSCARLARRQPRS